MNTIVHVQDKGQDAVSFTCDEIGRVVDVKPVFASVWQGAVIPVGVHSLCAVGKHCPIHSENIRFGFLDYIITKIEKSMKKTQEQQMQDYFEEACLALGINNSVPEVSLLPERNQKAIIAFYMLSVIIQWVNEGWVADFKDYYQRKWYPYFYFKNGGLSASSVYNVFSSASSNLGALLAFKTESSAIEWANKLLPLYEDYLLIK